MKEAHKAGGEAGEGVCTASFLTRGMVVPAGCHFQGEGLCLITLGCAVGGGEVALESNEK